jgi:hypothetical protein
VNSVMRQFSSGFSQKHQAGVRSLIYQGMCLQNIIRWRLSLLCLQLVILFEI